MSIQRKHHHKGHSALQEKKEEEDYAKKQRLKRHGPGGRVKNFQYGHGGKDGS